LQEVIKEKNGNVIEKGYYNSSGNLVRVINFDESNYQIV
jgi:hypothetical protein